ncbi:MAG: sarcosine oxidase subunit gamma family protein [Cypionkella sp.]|nr:sarcosine oxidase subunit gamma family protein [Cypionkella sp.]
MMPVSSLNGASFSGYTRIRDIGPLGMISVRAKADVAGLDGAIKAATGCAVPPQRQILRNGDCLAGWMSPDEYLLIMPIGQVDAALDAIAKAMAGQHHLAVDVSGARAVFSIDSHARSVLAKLSPTDFDAMKKGELRRTRLAQVAAAFWLDGDAATVVCFASVAQYVFDLLSHAAAAGTEI